MVLYGYTPYDVYVYVKNKKQPIGIPMPSSSIDKEKLKQLIESKRIEAEWGIYS